MRLSPKALAFHTHLWNHKLQEIYIKHESKLQELKIRRPPNVAMESLVAQYHVERWKEMIAVYLATIIETHEKYNIELESDDVDHFYSTIEGWRLSLVDAFKDKYLEDNICLPYIKDQSQSIILSAKSQLHLYVLEKELGGKEILNPSSQQAVNFFGDINGAVQLWGSQNSQNVFINDNSEFSRAINQLLQIIKNSSLDAYDKDDAIEAIHRLPKLARDKENPGALERAEKKISSLETTLSKAGNILETARPALKVITDWFQSS